MMKYWISFFFTFLLTATGLQAQRLEKFSEDPAEFFKQLENLMTASKSKDLEEAFDAFSIQWNSGVFTEANQTQIRQTADLMLAQSMTANPDFKNYLHILTILKNDENGEARFSAWHEVAVSVLLHIKNRKLNPYHQFIDFSYPFLERGALRISDLGTNWLTNAKDYQLVFENEMPLVKYDKLDLIAERKGDSIVIKTTAGVYSIVEEIWSGEGGQVTWERFGLEPDVYAELGTYEIETKNSLYEVGKVKMHYPLFFGNRMVEGSFSDKVVSKNNTAEGSYPRFESTNEILLIKNLGEGIEYRGGFRLHGTTVYGFGTSEAKAEIQLSNNKNELLYRGKAALFTIKREERIVGERVASTIYFGRDSIYHPSVNFRFDIPGRELQLSRGNRGSDRNPFFDSFHQVNIDAERLDYSVDKDSLYFDRRSLGFGKRINPTMFESLQYFEESDYRRLQNIASTNPIALLKVAFNETGERVIEADRVAQKLNPKFSVENINSLLYELVSQGFINYDAESGLVELKDKIFHYADASQKKVDFDILKISSETNETNGVFDLRDKSLAINGVSNVELSYPQKVAFKPLGESLRMRQNRDMDFDGKLFAGFTTYVGKDFHFQYAPFQVTMDSCRYFDMYLPTGELDENKRPLAYSIGSRIEHLNGVLLVDAPANKSGREEIEIFPSLESKKNSFVYYDYPKIQGGAYVRDSFYFKLKPFSIPSLDKYAKNDIHFKGEMYPAGIFPVFDETLLVKEDTSLGFLTTTPVAGFPSYQGKGNFKGKIDLSNKGFLGQGTLNYLGAVVNSEDFIFKPKQLTGSAERFDLAENRLGKIEVPQATGKDVTIDWRPYEDSMYVSSKEAPFELFKEGLHTLKGTLILTPSGLKARGLFDWDKASMNSTLFSFGAHAASADTSDLKIKAFNAGALALTTSNLNGRVDFDEQMGRFRANAEFLTTTLPYNQYETSFNEFDWDMKKETVNFKVKEGKLGSFRSIHPDQDSLWFQGKTALYDLKSNYLKIGGVPYIVTSDAFVYPETGDIEVQPNAVITELTNARIVADTINHYHVINRAKVKILGKKEYRASGFYEYNIGDKKQEIEFAEIIGTRVGKGSQSTKASVTRATGQVKERDQFFIDHKTKFQGTISLEADKPNLRFEGFAELQSPSLPSTNWFSLSCEGDKNDLSIAYDTPLSPDGEQLFTGLFLSKETASAYPRVMMPTYFRKDRAILPVKGIFQYDEKGDKFIFGDSLKVLGGASVLRGNKLVYDNKTGKIEMEGKLNLGSALTNVSVQAAGNVTTQFGEMLVDTLMGTSAMSSELKAEVMLGANIILPASLMKIVASDFQSSTFDATPIVFAKDMNFYRHSVAELFPENDDMRQAIDGISIGTLVIPKKYNKFSFLFDKIPMNWDRDYQSFVSTTKKLGLMSVDGETVNTYITAYIEVKMPTNDDDRLYIYLKSPSQLYYFFGYRQGVLNVASNNTRFMDELLGLKEKERIIKVSENEVYEIAPVEEGTAQAFVNRIEAVQKN
ncbi:MAG: hypothetical protein EPO28_15990 [Saprospiraceae bacterium]|nr:MAG: hypothetical protein EPO28_15990 [Saprospiraceae bacterium]